MKFFSLLTFLLLSLSQLTAQASSEAYSLTIQLCQKHDLSKTLTLSSAAAKDVVFDFNILKTSKKLTTLLANDDFYTALNHCYGKDEQNKSLFVASLIAADISGKALGAIGLIYAYRILLAKPLLLLKEKNIYLYYSVQTVLNGSIFHSIYKSYNEQKNIQNEILAKSNPALATALEMYQQNQISKEQIPAVFVENFNKNTKLIVDNFSELIKTEALAKRSQLVQMYLNSKNYSEKKNILIKIRRLDQILLNNSKEQFSPALSKGST